MIKHNLQDRFTGCLLGVGIGDALGLPLEGWSAKKIQANHGYVTGYLEGVLPRGSISDDTQLTILLAESLTAKGCFDPQDFAKRLSEWPGYQIGGGLTCLTAASRLAKGVHYCESGVKSAGCGAAMRSAPIGLFYCNEPEKLIDCAVSQARITHNDPRAAAGAFVVAMLVALGVKNDSFEEESFLELLAPTRKISPEMAAKLEIVPKLLDASWEEAVSVLGTSGFVLEAVSSAIWVFWRNQNSFSEAIHAAINLGGDTDSRGAITGAIAGAYLGRDKIPPGLIAGLNQAATTRLEQLAKDLNVGTGNEA